MIYKNNMLLSMYILFCLQILHFCGGIVSKYYSLDDAIFDVTTIYKITNKSIIDDKVGFKSYSFLTEYNGSYAIEIHSRTKAVGIPVQNEKYKLLRTNVKDLFNVESIRSFKNSSHLNISFYSDFWRVKKFFPDGDVCNDQRYITTTHTPGYIPNYIDTVLKNCFNTFEYSQYYFDSYQRYYYYNNLKFFSLSWIPDIKSTCLSITYINKLGFGKNISMKIFNSNDGLIYNEILGKHNDMKILQLTDITLKKDQEYVFSLEVISKLNRESNSYDNLKFGLYRIAPCSNYDEEVRTVSFSQMDTTDGLPKPVTIFGNHTNIYTMLSAQKTEPCLNGGYFINTLETKTICVCPPGFNGKYCETACGMNSYGPDCNGVCSIDNDMCRGMFMCTQYECTCPAGLTGPWCNEDCESDKYGSDCNQTCPENCRNQTCDQYTGFCLNGCSPGYILPDCIKKYPYFKNAPIPISIDFETIKFELNFQSHNIKGGDESIYVKYYQIFYKSLSEDKFSYSDMKLINQNDNSTTEILDDLLPKTKYLVGVLLITEDGNHNDQDVVYGEYMTSCIQPQTTDYNVKLTSGIKSIFVTWNKITPGRLECNINEYVLILQLSNQSQNLVNYTQEIIASSDRGHLIDNLLPGFQYDIKLTPKTVNGPLLSSPKYSVTTLTRGNNVRINNLTIKNEERKIKINWMLVNLHKNTVKEPLTCIIRYKIVQILSCSLREIERNWTSIKVFNITNYEIFDVIPNSQYLIQVLVDNGNISTTQHQNMFYILTSVTYPETEPILNDENPIVITKDSVQLQWKVDPNKCSKLNGFFSKFYITLKDNTEDKTLQIKETKQNYISFDGLKSNTAYTLKVFIKTHVGFNHEHFLLVNFTTKYDDLLPVDDLMVYKKSLKNRMAGFRWSYVPNTNMDGFIVAFNNTSSVIPPERCSAWPQYYCHTFYNLSPSNTYTFKIMPRSLDYPEGGKVSSISFNSIDGLPDPPMNLKTTEVNNTSVTLQWDIPWIFNGVIKTFNINTEEISAVDMNTCCVSVTPIEIPFDEELPTYNYTLTDLKPGSTYSIGVLTVSKSLWYSSLARISIETLH